METGAHGDTCGSHAVWCGGKGDGESQSGQSGEGNQELTQVKVFKSHMGVGTIPGADNPHVQYVAERTGVEYQLVTTPPGSEPTEYLNLMIASDDLPDILRPIGGIEQTLIRQGGALALDDLRPSMPRMSGRISRRRHGMSFDPLHRTAKSIMCLKCSWFRKSTAYPSGLA